MTLFRNKNKFRIVIFQCFRGSAIFWYITEVSEMKKIYFKNVTATQWESVLIYWFKKRISIAVTKFQNIRYSLTNVKAEKNFRAIAQNIFRYVKTVHLNLVQNQLIMTWNALNCEFRFQISKPIFIITIKQFLHDFDIHAEIWHELTRRKFYFISELEFGSEISFSKCVIYSKQNSNFSRWETKNLDFFKIVSDFINFLNNTNQKQYAFVYQNQDSKDYKRKNFDRVFDSKTIIDFFFKIRLQITSKKNSISEKKDEKKILNINKQRLYDRQKRKKNQLLQAQQWKWIKR